MRFEIDKFSRKYVMYCPDRSSSLIFRQCLDAVGRRWGSGSNYVDFDPWGTYEESTVYYFNEGAFGSIDSAGKRGYKTLEFYDFSWGDDEDDQSDAEVISFEEAMFGSSVNQIAL